VSYVCAGKKFKSLSEAKVFAELVFKSKGVVVAIEKVSRKLQAERDARLNRAILRLRIPMMSIPKLYRELEAAVSEGKSDAELRAVVVAFPGVENVDG
jgi:hypothetical protein